jgi:hypothetical protein
MSAMKIPASKRKNPWTRGRGRCIYSDRDYIESIISLFVAGGECIEEMERLRADKGLKAIGSKW